MFSQIAGLEDKEALVMMRSQSNRLPSSLARSGAEAQCAATGTRSGGEQKAWFI